MAWRLLAASFRLRPDQLRTSCCAASLFMCKVQMQSGSDLINEGLLSLRVRVRGLGTLSKRWPDTVLPQPPENRAEPFSCRVNFRKHDLLVTARHPHWRRALASSISPASSGLALPVLSEDVHSTISCNILDQGLIDARCMHGPLRLLRGSRKLPSCSVSPLGVPVCKK